MVEIDGTYEIAAPAELVWEMILDPDVLANVVPGCDKLENTGENKYKGKMRIKVGPVDGVYKGTLTLSDLQPMESFHLEVNGRGASGNVRGEGDVQLEAGADGGTLLRYKGKGEVSGRMATVGQRLTQSSANAITKQCLVNLDRQVDARVDPPTVEIGAEQIHREPVVPQAPSQTDFVMGVAREMLDECVPDPKQRRMFLGLAVLPLLFITINIFAELVAKRVVKKLQSNNE